MALTPAYTVGQATESGARRRSLLDELADIGARKQAEAARLYQQELADLKRREWEQATNWHQMAGRGAATGLAIGGPMGAAVGGIGGALLGQIGAIRARREAGQGLGKAIGRTLFDIDPMRATKGAIRGAGGAVGLAGAGANINRYRQQQAAQRALGSPPGASDTLLTEGTQPYPQRRKYARFRERFGG